MALRSPGDAAVLWLAERQHGLVTREQLAACGLTQKAVRHRVARGLLWRVHPGVFSAGELPTTLPARALAAVLAHEPDPCASHRSAAELLGLLPSRRSPVHLTVVGRHTRGGPGVIVHRTAALAHDERRIAQGVPVTSTARALLDLAASTEKRELGHAFDEALSRGLVTSDRLRELTDRYAHRRGGGRLRRLLHSRRVPFHTRSEAERRYLDLIVEAGLPRPETNVPAHGFELDVLWRDEGLAVEIDGFA